MGKQREREKRDRENVVGTDPGKRQRKDDLSTERINARSFNWFMVSRSSATMKKRRTVQPGRKAANVEDLRSEGRGDKKKTKKNHRRLKRKGNSLARLLRLPLLPRANNISVAAF